MKTQGRFTLLVVAIAAFSASSAGKIIYVDDDAQGAGDGSSWENAYVFLQDALADADASEEAVEIHIAQGLYRPDQGTAVAPGDRTATFELTGEVILRGGYAGVGGPDPNARRAALFETVLSGDLAGNDVTFEQAEELLESRNPTRSDNSYHIVTIEPPADDVVLDGLLITAGHALSEEAYEDGAGIRINSGNVTLLSCAFRANAALSGAAIYSTVAVCELTGCDFADNAAHHDGGGICTGGNLVLDECRFDHNVASSGGGLYAAGHFATVTDCTFTRNTARRSGGAFHNSSLTNARVESSTFSSNRTGWRGGAICSGYGDTALAIRECIFETNRIDQNMGPTAPPGSGGAIFVGGPGGYVSLEHCRFVSNASVDGGAMSAHTTASISGCEFVGNVASGRDTWTFPSCGGALSVTDKTTIAHCLFSGNSTDGHGGAIYAFPVQIEMDATVQHCTFAGNSGSMGSALLAVDQTRLLNCIVWDGPEPIWSLAPSPSGLVVKYTNIQGGWPGEGNIDADPCFADPGHWDPNGTPGDPNDDFWVDGDYHLRSQAGRWDPVGQSWVRDTATSLCIDAGDPSEPIGAEPFPNGGIINMGVYGGTSEASKSYLGEPVCETIVAGDINGDCIIDYSDFAVLASHWLVQGQDFVNQPPTVRVIQPSPGDVFDSPTPIVMVAEATDPDGSVVSVSFSLTISHDSGTYRSGRSDRDGTDGWQATWDSWDYVGLGECAECRGDITATATDNHGAVGVSNRVSVTLRK